MPVINQRNVNEQKFFSFLMDRIKRYVACCSFSLFVYYTASAQWDSTYRPDIYRSRVETFRKLPVGKKDILFLGDSITFWGDWSELTGKKNLKNRGMPGDTSFGLLEMLPELIKGEPHKIFIMIGINDLARGMPQEVIIENYKRILQIIRIESPHSKVYFQSVLPVNEEFGKLKGHYKRANEIKQLNSYLSTWTKEQEVGFVNVFDSVVGDDGKLKNEYTWDGVHLTWNGYQAWLQLLKKEKLI